MVKVLMVAPADLDDISSGVWNKVNSQAISLNKIYGNVSLVVYKGRQTVVRHYEGNNVHDEVISNAKHLPRKIVLWLSLCNYIKNKQYEYAYVRYPVIDFLVLRVFKRLKKNGTKIVMEVPTYPLGSELIRGKIQLAFMLDRLIHNRCSRYVHKIVYIGNPVDKIFKCKAQQIPNGIVAAHSEDEITGFALHGDRIRIIAVSSMHVWHGYERILEGIKNYYLTKTPELPEIELTLVGEGQCLEEYQHLVKQYKIDNYVTFPGKLCGEDLVNEYRKATLGVGSLSLYKNHLLCGSTLKSKEYMIRGLPFLYGCEEIGIERNYPYALLVSNDSQPVNMKKVVDFIVPLLKNNQKISREMYQFALKNFSWTAIMKSIFKDM